jgi:Dynamin family
MTPVETIRVMSEHAQRVLAAAEADLADAAAVAPPALAQVRDLARTVLRRAAAPVAVGVVGGFSAGKSLLLGALVGWADALPVSEVPTTGNLTELRLLPPDHDGPAQLGDITVEFLDQRTATELLREFLGELAGPEEKPRLAGADRVTCLELRERGDWAVAETWARRLVGGAAAADNPQLQSHLRELAWFARCASSPAGKALLGAADAGRRRTVPAAVARPALELPRAGAVPAADAPVPPSLAGPPPAAPTADFIRAAFPLIARVSVEVRVPRALWDLAAALGERPFVMLDFPGLGAAASGLRDELLCRRALREVQTILVVLDGQRPGEKTGQELVDMLRRWHQSEGVAEAQFRDRVLVAVNRFDLLPLGNREPTLYGWTGWDATARSFGTPKAVAPTEAAVGDGLPAVGEVLNRVRELVDPPRAVFTSGWWGLLALSRAVSAGRPVGSPAVAARLAGDDWPAPLALQWGTLAARLSAADPTSPLAGWLAEAARDGGRAALQRLLTAHVAEHGLRQLAQDVAEQFRLLRTAVAQVPPPPPPSTGRLTAAEIGAQLRGLIRSLNAFAGRTAVELLVEHGGQRRPVWNLVRSEIGQRVWGWQEWRDLLHEVGPDGKISPYPRHAVPQDSRSLREPYCETMAAVAEYARDLLRQAIQEEFRDLSGELGQAAGRLAGELGPDAAQRVEQLIAAAANDAARQRLRGQWEALRQVLAADDQAFYQAHLKVQQQLDEAADELGRADRFPLPGAGDKENPLLFPWHPARQSLGQGTGPHQLYVFRLRNHVTAGARHHAGALVSSLSEDVLDAFQQLFRSWRRQLEGLLTNRPLLGCLGNEASAPAAARGWLTAQVPAPRVP